jgi:hypothetical protein
MSLVIQAHGGLGNQLFQAQYAHFISKKLPMVEISFRSTHKADKRLFELERFFERCSHVNQQLHDTQFESFRNHIFEGLKRRNLEKYLFFWDYIDDSKEISIEDLVKYQSGFRKASIRGYFQSSLFNGDSCFKSLLHSKFENHLGIQTQKFNTVVHIRKGDFQHFISHGPLSNLYFENILKNIESNNSVLHTDAEPDELSSFLLGYFSQIKYSKTNSAWDLLEDAVNCTNFIGSNSSLSWWAARSSEWFSNIEPEFISLPNRWKRENCNAQETLILPNWQLSDSIWQD